MKPCHLVGSLRYRLADLFDTNDADMKDDLPGSRCLASSESVSTIGFSTTGMSAPVILSIVGRGVVYCKLPTGLS